MVAACDGPRRQRSMQDLFIHSVSNLQRCAVVYCSAYTTDLCLLGSLVILWCCFWWQTDIVAQHCFVSFSAVYVSCSLFFIVNSLV